MVGVIGAPQVNLLSTIVRVERGTKDSETSPVTLGVYCAANFWECHRWGRDGRRRLMGLEVLHSLKLGRVETCGSDTEDADWSPRNRLREKGRDQATRQVPLEVRVEERRGQTELPSMVVLPSAVLPHR
jgi:hypothetical protein